MAIFISSDPFERLMMDMDSHPLYPHNFAPSVDSFLGFPIAFKPEPPKYWTCKKELNGFHPRDVNIKVEENEVLIHGRTEDGEDYIEMKKHVKLPENIDRKTLTCAIRNNFVILIAEYVYKKPEPKEIKIEAVKGKSALKHKEAESKKEAGHKEAEKESEANGQVAETNEHKQIVKGNDFGIFMPGFKPEDIKVKVTDDNVLTVEASSSSQSGGSYCKKEMVRSLRLPEGVNSDNLKTVYNKDGYLEVLMPKQDEGEEKMEAEETSTSKK